MLKLRKVELLGFKSFCEKTPITFSGSGITCIVGPNGCGKSNVVDAISWVLGEQSHKMLRAERMSDCIFNGTAKRPPMGLSEVTLTLVDPELADAVAKVLAAPEEIPAEAAAAESPESSESSASTHDDPLVMPSPAENSGDAEASSGELAAGAGEPAGRGKPWKKRGAEKPAMHLKPGRSGGGAAALSLRAERICDQWPRGTFARRAGTFHGHGSGPG